jgi:hypothetical protein
MTKTFYEQATKIEVLLAIHFVAPGDGTVLENSEFRQWPQGWGVTEAEVVRLPGRRRLF